MSNNCAGHKHCGVMKVAWVLLLIGGLNWGLVGLGMLIGSNLNVVGLIFGSMPTLEAIIYLLVGIAAVMKIIGCKCKTCKGNMSGGNTTQM